MRGYPGVAGLDRQGRMVTQAVRQPGAVSTVTLAPGQTASALLQAGVVPTGTATSCPSDYVALLVTSPNLTVSAQITIRLPACDGLSVRAVVPGATGLPGGA